MDYPKLRPYNDYVTPNNFAATVLTTDNSGNSSENKIEDKYGRTINSNFIELESNTTLLIYSN
jgi:hypothetical protein